MVWTKENVINFLNAKVKDISYFEYPIPIELLLEEINLNKHTHDILTNVKILIGIINNDLSDKLEIQMYGQKQAQLRREYVVSKVKCKLSPALLHQNISNETFKFEKDSTTINSSPILSKIIKHIKSRKSSKHHSERRVKKRKKSIGTLPHKMNI